MVQQPSPQVALTFSAVALAGLILARRAQSTTSSSGAAAAAAVTEAADNLSFAGIAERRKTTKLKKSILYTGTGDKGSSSLYNGERRSKKDATFEALGATDELNATLGLAREHCLSANNGLVDLLTEIQSRLLDVGAAIATPRDRSNETKLAYTEFPARHTKELEYAIDELDSKVQQQTCFSR